MQESNEVHSLGKHELLRMTVHSNALATNIESSRILEGVEKKEGMHDEIV